MQLCCKDVQWNLLYFKYYRYICPQFPHKCGRSQKRKRKRVQYREGEIGKWKVAMFILVTLLSTIDFAYADGVGDNLPKPVRVDSVSLLPADKNLRLTRIPAGIAPLPVPHRFIHRFSTEVRPTTILPTNDFVKGENALWRRQRNSISLHLKYSFQFSPHTYADRIYRSAYQGIGVACYSFGNSEEMGEPLAVYLFQGARILRFHPRLSLNYEWNFGVSFGWKPYDYNKNYYNQVIGSRANAYLNTNFYFNWMFSRQIDLNVGVTLSHFSNGNTGFPNAGINTLGMKVGVVYNFNRDNSFFARPLYHPLTPDFHRHVSYDLVLFGSWRRKGRGVTEQEVASLDAYGVAGFNFAPMYNLGYKFRLGASFDGVYDGSANIYSDESRKGGGKEFVRPSLDKQMALGLSARAEYVMPYFTIGVGFGTNVLHRGGDWGGFYQVLALKIEMTRNSFLHIGYNLKDFKDPNYLMLGFGFRFHNKYPTLHR